MTGTTTPEPLFVDPDVAYQAFANVEHGDSLSAVRQAYNRAALNVLANNRKAVQVEVILRVAP